MKYSIEYKNGKYVEKLEINGITATKTWQHKEGVTFVCSNDPDFLEQLEETLDETFDDSFREDIYNTFDGNLWVDEISYFVENNGLDRKRG